MGPDGNLWFAITNNSNYSIGHIGRITRNGAVTQFSNGISSAPLNLTGAPDGNVWFTEANGAVGRITPSGVVTEFSTGFGSSNVIGITGGTGRQCMVHQRCD